MKLSEMNRHHMPHPQVPDSTAMLIFWKDKSNWIDFVVIERDQHTNEDTLTIDIDFDTDHFTQATRFLVRGSIKYDGCCNFMWGNDIMHFCGRSMTVKMMTKLFEEMYDLAEKHVEAWQGD